MGGPVGPGNAGVGGLSNRLNLQSGAALFSCLSSNAWCLVSSVTTTWLMSLCCVSPSRTSLIVPLACNRWLSALPLRSAPHRGVLVAYELDFAVGKINARHADDKIVLVMLRIPYFGAQV